MNTYRIVCLCVLLSLGLGTNALAQTSPEQGSKTTAAKRVLSAHPNASVQYSLNGTPSLISNINQTVAGKTDKARAINALTTWAPVLGVAASDLVAQHVQSTSLNTAVRFGQFYGKLPVMGHGVAVTLSKTGKVLSISSHVATWSFVAKGNVTDAQAKLTATQHLFGKAQKTAMPEAKSKRVVIAAGGKAVEAYMIGLPRTRTMFQPLVFVSTTDGKVIGVRDAALK